MPKAAIRQNRRTEIPAALYMALEIGENTWNVGFKTAPAQPVRERTIPARDGASVLEEIVRAKRRYRVPQDTRVVAKQLRFITPGGPAALKFVDASRLDRQTLRGVRRLEPSSAALLDQLV